MFIAYAFFIGAGAAGAAFAVTNILDKLWGGALTAAMMIAAMLLLIAPFLLYDYFSHKHKKYSLFMQDEAALEMWDVEIRKSEEIGGRLGVSDNYIFSACSTFYIPVFFSKDAIKTIYSRRHYRKGRLISDPNMYVICQSGELYKLPMGGRLIGEKGGLAVEKGRQALDEWILSRIHAHMPHVQLGILNAPSLTKNSDAVAPLNFDVSEHV